MAVPTRPRGARSSTRFIASVASFAFASSVSAQLLVSQDDPLEPIWNYNPATGQAQSYLTGFGAGALAVDEANQILYFMPSTVQLYKWNFGTPGAMPEFIGNTHTATSSPFSSVLGLAVEQTTGKLFASKGLGNSNDPEGFYEVNTTNGFLTLRLSVSTATNGSSPYDFGGFDYDSATGKFYAISDPTTSGGGLSGLYEVDLNTGVTLRSAYPITNEPIPEIDGLAVGNGRAYLVEDNAVQAGGRIHVFNFATNLYEAPLQTPWFFNEIFAGATWSPALADALAAQVPEPSAVALVAAGSVALLRRRSRRR